MWRRVVSSSSALESLPGRSSRSFLVSSSLEIEPLQGSFSLSSFYSSFASASSSAFATNPEHEEADLELQGRNNTSRQSTTYGQTNQEWQQNPNAVNTDGSRASGRMSYQSGQQCSRGFMESTEFVNMQQSGNFSGFRGPENGRSQQTAQQDWTPLGHGSRHQNSHMAYQEKPRERSTDYQQNTISYNMGNSSTQNQQKLNDIYSGGQYPQSIGYGRFQPGSPVGQYQQNHQVGQRQQSLEVRQYQRNHQVGQCQQSLEVRQYQRNHQVGQHQQSLDVRQYQQSPGVGQHHQIPQVEQYQQSPHVGQYQERPHFGQYQQSPQVGRYQQSPQAGYYQQSSEVGQYQQSPQVGHQQSLQVGEPAEASDGNPNTVKGTVEELELFCKEGKVKEAMEVLGLLKSQNVQVSLDQYFQLMHACGEASALEEAKIVYENMKLLSPLDVRTYNRILEMFSKCGSMEDASLVFNDTPKRNLTSWDIMITWSAKNGLGEDAIDLFTQFKEAGLKPDDQMFDGVLYACSVVGDAAEGLLHFESMSKDYGIIPTMKNYVSVVNMLGSIGLLDEALEFIEKIPSGPNVDVWKTLMHYCRVHGYMELGDRCAELFDQLDPSCLTEQSKAGLIPVNESDLVKEKEKKQLAAKNLLEIRSRVHEYRAGDRSHPNTEKFYALLRGLREQMKEAGYIPETRFVLHDIDQEGKEDALLSHSERLAVADGLLSSSARSPIRVIKNLRVCGDCHSALKIISKLVGRELIMRDAKRFHHLKDGKCSCNDYW